MKRYVWLLFLFVFTLLAKAQVIPFKHFTAENGLPSNICYRILQDEKGFIWILTEKGIAVYNGYNFIKYNTKEKMPFHDIWGLMKDKDHRMWVYTQQGKNNFIYHDSIFNIKDFLPDLAQPIIYCYPGAKTIIINRNEKDASIYYFNQQNSLSKLSVDQETHYLLREKMDDILFVDFSERYLSILTIHHGFIQIDMKMGKRIQRTFKDQIDLLYDSYMTNENMTKRYCFRSGDSLFNYSMDHLSFKTLIQQTNVEKGVGLIIGATDQFIMYKKGNEILTLDTNFKQIKFYLPKLHATVSQIYEDVEKNLWLVTLEDGIYFFNHRSLRTRIYDKFSGLEDDQIISIAGDNKGRILLGNIQSDHLQILDHQQITKLYHSQVKMYDILCFDDDILVIPSLQALSKKPIQFLNKVNDEFEFKSQKVNGNSILSIKIGVKKLFKFDEHTFYVGASNALYKFKLMNHVISLEQAIELKGIVYGICAYKSTLYIASTQGVYKFEDEKLRYLGEYNSSFSYYARDIKVDKFGGLWVANDKNSLEYFPTYKTKPHLITELGAGLVTSMAIDTIQNEIYACSSDGLWKLYNIKYNPFSYQAYQYTTRDGLAANEVNCVLLKDNELYVGTAAGFSILPKQPMASSWTPALYCSKILINQIEMPISEAYELDYTQNNIQVQLSAVSYQSEGNINYAYRLLNTNSAWTITHERVIEFSGLAPGDYIFEAKALDANHAESKQTIRIKLNIKPPIWKTWTFIGLLSLVLFSIGGGTIYWRTKRVKQREIVAANLKQQLAEVKLEALQSQLNSHFVFNSLNAIQKFILNHDEVSASEYMNKFASLIRGFLESSKSKSIPLHREIDLLKLYIDLERLRFNDKFDVEFIVDHNVEFQELFPTNIIQPFVENSILHGLLNNTSKGKLSIHFSEYDDYIQCLVEDNGIGRKASYELNKDKERKSYGTELIQDRINSLLNQKGARLDIQFVDKNELNQGESGTKVIIKSYK